MANFQLFLSQYSIILLLLFIVLLVIGILGYVFIDAVKDSIDMAMSRALLEYDDQKQNSVKFAWDHAQTRVRKCALTSIDASIKLLMRRFINSQYFSSEVEVLWRRESRRMAGQSHSSRSISNELLSVRSGRRCESFLQLGSLMHETYQS